jgi:hypothetical protein
MLPRRRWFFPLLAAQIVFFQLVQAEPRYWALARRLFLTAAAQFIAAWAEFDVARGQAAVTCLAVHVLFGLGFVFDICIKRNFSISLT